MTRDYGYFQDADEAWLPTYGDLVVRQGEEQGPVTDYNRYGWKALEVPSDCSIVSSRMDQLNTRFEQRYCDRMISYETWDLWQVKLQERFDSLVYVYERAYRLYNANADAIDADVMPGRRVTFSDKASAGGTDKVTNSSETSLTDSVSGSRNGSDSKTVKNSDTPSSAISTSDNFAGSISKENGSDTSSYSDRRTNIGSESSTSNTDYGRTDTRDSTTTETVTGGQVLENINDSIDRWRDLDTGFVNEFQDMFLKIWWYR